MSYNLKSVGNEVKNMLSGPTKCRNNKICIKLLFSLHVLAHNAWIIFIILK